MFTPSIFLCHCDPPRFLKFIQDRVGGVNLRADQADIQIQEDENGFKFPKFDPAMRMMPLERLTPVILDLKFITIADAAMKLGLAVPAEDSSDNVYSPDKAREQELLTAL